MSQLQETPQNTPIESVKKVIELSRDALAQRLWLKTEELPDRKFFKIVDEQLDRLAGLDPRDKARALRDELSRIQIAEVADKAKELWKDGLDTVKILTPEVLTTGLKTTTDKIRTDMWKWGAEVLWAVGEIVNAGNIEWVTGGIGKLSKAIDAVSGTISSSMKWLWEMFSSLMAMLGFDKLWASIKGLFGMKSEEKKDDSSQKKIEDWVGKVKEMLKSPEKQREELRTKSWETFQKKYGNWIQDKEVTKKKFDSTWDKYASGMKEIPEEISQKIASGDIINPMASSEKLLKTNGTFIIDLVNEWVLPIEALRSQMMFGVHAGLQIGIRTARSLMDNSTHQVDDMVWYLSGEDLSQLDPAKKKVLFAHFYHNMAFATWFMGRTAWSITKLAMLPISWENATGWEQAKVGYKTLMGDMDGAAKQIESIASHIGVDKSIVTTQIKWARKAITDLATEGRTRFALSEAFIVNKGDYTKVMETLWKLKQDVSLNKGIIEDFAKLDNSTDPMVFRKDFANKMENLTHGGSKISTPHAITLNIRESLWSLEWKKSADELTGVSRNMNKTLATRIMHFDNPVFNEYYKIRSAIATTKYAHYLDRNILPIVVNDTQEAKATIQRLQYHKLPWAVAGVFDSLSFLVITKHAVDENSAMTFIKDTYELNPLISGVALVKEWFDIETKEWLRMDKIGYIGAGGALLSLSAFQLYQIASAPTLVAWASAFGNFIASPIMAAGRFASGSVQTARLTTQYIRHASSPRGIKAWLELAQTMKWAGRLAIVWSIIASSIGGYMYYQNMRDEEMVADLKKRKILKEDGSYDMWILNQEFSGLAADVKINLYEQFTSNILQDIPHRNLYDKEKKIHTVEFTDPKWKWVAWLDMIENIKSLGELTGEKSTIGYVKSAAAAMNTKIDSLPVSSILKKELGNIAGSSLS